MRSIHEVQEASRRGACGVGSDTVAVPSTNESRSCDSSEHRAVSVSFQTELPEPLQRAMSRFIERHPNWDQYRLVQAALAGFLVQNGVSSRAITRLYVGNLFCRHSLLQDV
jgi:hypothetical protein